MVAPTIKKKTCSQQFLQREREREQRASSMEQRACPVKQRAGAHKTQWHVSEDMLIAKAIQRFGTSWARVAELCGRSEDAVRNRWHRLQKGCASMRTGDDAGDDDLDRLHPELELEIEMHPEKSRQVRALWTVDEDRIIEEGFREYGCKWRLIAARLPGRSDSSARNRWLRVLKDRQVSGIAGIDLEGSSSDHGLDGPSIGAQTEHSATDSDSSSSDPPSDHGLLTEDPFDSRQAATEQQLSFHSDISSPAINTGPCAQLQTCMWQAWPSKTSSWVWAPPQALGGRPEHLDLTWHN